MLLSTAHDEAPTAEKNHSPTGPTAAVFRPHTLHADQTLALDWAQKNDRLRGQETRGPAKTLDTPDL